ncbi:MAG: VOC family protein [Anaerolineales bacterium]|nr:VOC family protein [Anaerolineales bacterium]
MSTMPTDTSFQIHPDTQIAHVELQVRDLDNMLAFYNGLMGFHLLEQGEGRARLSAAEGGQALLTLVHNPAAELQPSSTYGVGLYHTAFLFPGRGPLATTLLRVAAGGWPLQGASDHQVSEAIYFADPEGNGIEIYRDRPRADWPRLQDSIQMGNLPLDLNKLVEEADREAAETGRIDPQTVIGHIHLQVSDTAAAQAFYGDLLGFEVMMAMPTALFMAAGGYHHHLGANIWHSRGAPLREAGKTGLLSYGYQVPDLAGWDALVQRLEAGGQTLQPIERDGVNGVVLQDQDGIRVELLGPAS